MQIRKHRSLEIEMFSYGPLLKQIDDARAKTAKFHLVDLHVHTIGSTDYPTIHDKPGFITHITDDEKDLRSQPDVYYQRFIAGAKQKGIRLVAITDHNEADIAEKLSTMSDPELLILPGIEISVQTSVFKDHNIHILAIFPEGTTSKQIDKVFPPSSNMPPSGKREGASTNQPLAEIIKTIEDMQGISIAAHVSSTNGIRTAVHSQNVAWLQKNYLRRYLKERKKRGKISDDENKILEKLDKDLKPLDDDVQNVFLKCLADHNFSAIQIQEGTHQVFYSGEHVDALNLPPFACVLSSDAHTLADVGCVDHRTYVKMADVSLNGLKKALRDPGTRIRFDSNIASNRLRRILGIAYEGGSFDGQVIGFSDNLTALIGSRGTGKSALIESLRFLLCQPIDSLPGHLGKAINDRLDFTLRETELKMIFSDEQGEFVVLKRRFGESKTSCFSIDGQPLPEIELPTSSQVRAEIFGWSEIEELSDSPRKQLSLLDRTIPEINNLKAETLQKLEELRKNNDKIISLSREIQNLLLTIQDADEIRMQLQRLNRPELNDAFENYDLNSDAQKSLNNISKRVDDIKTWLSDHGARRDIKKNLEATLAVEFDGKKSFPWVEDFSKVFSASVLKIHNTYNELFTEVTGLKTSIKNHLDELKKEQGTIEAQLNSLAEQSGQGDFKAALSKRKEYSDRDREISSVEKEIKEKQKEIKRLLEIRNNALIPDLGKARTLIYKDRLEKVRKITEKLSRLQVGMNVTVEIDQLGEKGELKKALGYQEKSKTSGLFKGIDRHYLSKDYPGFYSSKFSPHEFVNLFLSDTYDCSQLSIRYIRNIHTNQIVRLVSGSVELVRGKIIEKDSVGNRLKEWPDTEYDYVEMTECQKIWDHISPLSNNGVVEDYFIPEKLKALLSLDLVDIEDYPSILLDGRPIEGLSPGQRCSALIPIILVEGDNPLVIDQPEDNLDNKLVFDLVVDIIRGLKEQRQIIIATHNPNIPVSGDAEQVVVFEAPSKDQCCAIEQGSIDDDTIVKHIKNIMEGGDKAFETRVKKYGLFQST